MTLETLAGCTLRPVSDIDAALDLWASVFPVSRKDFAEFVHSDPWRREGDILGAFDGGELVSAVGLIRRPLRWRGETIWCGGIGAVATREDQRRHGLSRALLSQMIEKMETERIAFSLLFTDIHSHYSKLGWKLVETPQPIVTLGQTLPYASEAEEIEKPWDNLFRLYEHFPQPYLALERGEFHFCAASVERWENMQGRVLRLGDAGYVVVRRLEGQEHLSVIELVARDAESEEALVVSAARAAQRDGYAWLEFDGVPPLGQMELVRRLGDVGPEVNKKKMFRNVSLPEEEYTEITRLYSEGRAVWWRADSF
ncbi:MAG: GNAT family N-acetyltransferase [Armatimonadetes bacterium]|nr:GNAT family N-acetyltransferase [Armatimonadota bacterium]